MKSVIKSEKPSGNYYHYGLIILETAAGQARVCGFSASWLGATTLQTAFCKEEQQRQGAEKPYNLACSGVTHSVKLFTKGFFNAFTHSSTLASGLLPVLGL
jgi:hypothetical protein